MKLYLTLRDDDGHEVYRILEAEKIFSLESGGINDIVSDMLDTLEKSNEPL